MLYLNVLKEVDEISTLDLTLTNVVFECWSGKNTPI